ncbi:antitoxin Xre/MbcA/ParS toxin-binding domain-containing protein [Roseateles sp. BYS78W]|uniref:Antitoxin Xre/MbcA/ParS toxin-binding domain-containing protein n=1 Tax=Pelomonas candidula TaxID=3299025 RepID=A0ABW7HE93_9BURK
MPICFLDTEFTDLVQPRLLSLGLVSLAGAEHYVELDLATEAGQARKRVSSDFVRYDGVLDMWGLIPDAACTEWEMGRRTGEWLLKLSQESGSQGSRVEVAFDYQNDYELLEQVVRNSGLWERVREVVTPVDVGPLTGAQEGEIAAEQCFGELARRGLRRHHALADAIALKEAYIAVKAVAARMSNATHSDSFRQLAQHALYQGLDEAWLRTWLRAPAFGLGGRKPMDMLDEPGGLDALKDLVTRIATGTYS